MSSIDQRTLTKMAATSPQRRVLVIHNPTAGGNRRRRLRATLRCLEDQGCTILLTETARPGDAARIARDASPDICDVVVAAGGDGTINEVINGLVQSGSQVPLAIIPLGTANVMAAEIGLACTPRAAAKAILGGERRVIHLGVAGGRHFALMAGAGVDAHVVAGVDLDLKRRTGRLAYVWESLRQAFRYDFPELAVTVDGMVHRARMAVVCKGRCYGGPFVAAPDASLGEPHLWVVMLEKGGWWSVLRYGAALALGRLPGLADVSCLPARNIRIDGPSDAPVQGDGDVIAALPVDISLSDKTLELMVPG